ncbi:MAG: hypothetical protein EDM05_011765 [Leptolyngbya sp. IPPAS B-1204]
MAPLDPVVPTPQQAAPQQPIPQQVAPQQSALQQPILKAEPVISSGSAAVMTAPSTRNGHTAVLPAPTSAPVEPVAPAQVTIHAEITTEVTTEVTEVTTEVTTSHTEMTTAEIIEAADTASVVVPASSSDLRSEAERDAGADCE